MITKVKFQRYMASICIFNIFINKLSYCMNFSLIILLVVDKNFKIGDFYYAILPFSLTIKLLIKDNKKLLLNFQKYTKR